MAVKILLLGEAALDDFGSVVDFVRGRAEGEAARTAGDLETLKRLIKEDAWFPDLVVVLQAWPDQFSTEEVHELIALIPLARIVCCFGPWCDSDGRTRSIWPLAVRVSVPAAPNRLAHELALISNSDGPGRAVLPLTASRAEIFEFDFAGGAPEREPAMTAAVISPDRRWREMVESVLGRKDVLLRTADSADRPSVVLFDADPWNDERCAALRAIRAANPEARVVACAGFPRADLERGLRQSGADEVWFKLAPLAELGGAR